jgi:hypothetical protein
MKQYASFQPTKWFTLFPSVWITTWIYVSNINRREIQWVWYIFRSEYINGFYEVHYLKLHSGSNVCNICSTHKMNGHVSRSQAPKEKKNVLCNFIHGRPWHSQTLVLYVRASTPTEVWINSCHPMSMRKNEWMALSNSPNVLYQAARHLICVPR